MSETKKPDILHLEACNFIDKPMGGQLTFSRQLLKTFGNRLALVGLSSTPSEPIGRWFDKEIEGTVYRYFAIGSDSNAGRKPLVPGRLTTWFQIRRHRHRIFSIGIPNILLSESSILMALKMLPGYNLCLYSPGVEPGLSISRYPWAIRFASLFDHFLFRSLGRKANYILAAADDSAIEGQKHRAGERLKGKDIISFPTRVDTDIFHPADRLNARERLGLPADAIIVVNTGRIHWAKGWMLLMESFKLFLGKYPNAYLIFIGDGAESDSLKQKVLAMDLEKHVFVTGFRPPSSVAVYLQAADLFVMGSLKEGWSTAMVEALACHLPIVTTRFSSADTIVRDGINGYVVDQRDPAVFCWAMETALQLQGVAMYANSVIDRYALKNLAHDLLNVWPLVK